ncbi:effector-associated constant component EACC1 [Streptomyces sp. SD31]|uniref:effector-associated constant component EACC1 n=1 Tax=Streptomyces sp. SD31 TaxID=3452208 RepID=UPI003F8A902E
MDLIISLPDESEVASLAAWLRHDHSLARHIHVSVSAPPPDAVHGSLPQIRVTSVSAPALASVVQAVTVWLHSRRKPLEVTIQGSSGQRVVLTVSSPQDAAELSRVLAVPGSRQRDESTATADEITTQDSHASSEPSLGSITADGHTPPGPPLDPDDDDWLDLREK